MTPVLERDAVVHVVAHRRQFRLVLTLKRWRDRLHDNRWLHFPLKLEFTEHHLDLFADPVVTVPTVGSLQYFIVGRVEAQDIAALEDELRLVEPAHFDGGNCRLDLAIANVVDLDVMVAAKSSHIHWSCLLLKALLMLFAHRAPAERSTDPAPITARIANCVFGMA